MIVGIGTDIVEVERLKSSLSKSEALAKRVLTEFEFDEFSQSKQPERYLAKKFASKEATVKAIGTGIGRGMSWQDIEITHDTNGKPLLNARGAFADWCQQHEVTNLQISIADERDYASAFVILEKISKEQTR